ncbi:hypothetical protein C8Q76DRAFT_61101 [Earliella scabrosa]|nr:hypothetical protein C8Q76DRAFT_61101 [Earliella scabrosa]
MGLHPWLWSVVVCARHPSEAPELSPNSASRRGRAGLRAPWKPDRTTTGPVTSKYQHRVQTGHVGESVSASSNGSSRPCPSSPRPVAPPFRRAFLRPEAHFLCAAHARTWKLSTVKDALCASPLLSPHSLFSEHGSPASLAPRPSSFALLAPRAARAWQTQKTKAAGRKDARHAFPLPNAGARSRRAYLGDRAAPFLPSPMLCAPSFPAGRLQLQLPMRFFQQRSLLPGAGASASTTGGARKLRGDGLGEVRLRLLSSSVLTCGVVCLVRVCARRLECCATTCYSSMYQPPTRMVIPMRLRR